MALYQVGSKGPEVSQIQAQLQKLGLYLGPIDGIYGGGTAAAVRAFQQAQGLAVDGAVGPNTWAALFPGTPIQAPSIVGQSLDYRCLALTGSFETDLPIPDCFAGLSGDFDGQGISFGALQWNLGQGSLQPLLQEITQGSPQVLQAIFDQDYAELAAMLGASLEDQLAWARSIQDTNRHRVVEPWLGQFKALGRRPEFQAIEVKYAARLYQAALGLCATYGVSSQRAVALMFDIKVQNGSINVVVQSQIMQDFQQLDPALTGDDLEVGRLRIVANRRAEAANPRWVEDVRARKLTIANGAGTVHGNSYDLQGQYGISLDLIAA